MMRFLALLFMIASASEVAAVNAHRCSAPLVLPYDAEHPQPELEFDLSLYEALTPRFSAKGHGSSTATVLHWTGSWVRFEDGLQLIGTAMISDLAEEWRAEAVLVQSDVMILNLKRGTEDVLMVRCLTRLGE